MNGVDEVLWNGYRYLSIHSTAISRGKMEKKKKFKSPLKIHKTRGVGPPFALMAIVSVHS